MAEGEQTGEVEFGGICGIAGLFDEICGIECLWDWCGWSECLDVRLVECKSAAAKTSRRTPKRYARD